MGHRSEECRVVIQHVQGCLSVREHPESTWHRHVDLVLPLLQHARVVALEKQNRDLSWQVAMLARPGADRPHPPRATVAHGGSLPLHRQVLCAETQHAIGAAIGFGRTALSLGSLQAAARATMPCFAVLLMTHEDVLGKHPQDEPGKGTLPGVVGWVLRHRRALTISYLVSAASWAGVLLKTVVL